ncbi:hypothetical protein TSTA_039300 [Talaromyces stipitatus ATCC 10500]|uniref:Uncharacterized protein n=1 Tax=Talaromyces stipitatus (strain ATCC 10500 / CBS 375.48 / QM 6759 / NRRL 1006) TaxID=441959 RepID=B8M3Y6_TALSN|nr:uncharacterized protein TSTA_039300 [Talaromyces stipitatus ATCC 10500]EED20729.1 hypothetical protein TSTA_039300 [Talaromyces stipitatus ATCC 10500]
MKLLSNVSSLFCLLLALTVPGYSYPTAVNITAEDFMELQEIRVRADGTLYNTGITDINFVITQKGGTLVACDTPDSSTGTGYSVELGWSLSIGLDAEFDSVGLDISESQTYSVSNTFSCNNVADEKGDICVLFYQAVTAFTVQVTEVLECACGPTSTIDRGTAIVYAPNADQVGSIAGRGINVIQNGVQQCVGDSDRTINYYCGPPGTPGWWDGRGEGPWIEDYVNAREPAGCDIPIEANRYSD